MRRSGPFLAQLEGTVGDLEVGVALPEVAVIVCPQRAAVGERAGRVGIAGLELDVSSRLLGGVG
jgi:hypothetical protein